MRRGISEKTSRICDLYRSGIERGEHPSDLAMCLATMFNVQRPAIWKALRSGGALPPYQRQKISGKGRPQGGGIPGYTAVRRARSLSSDDYLASLPRVYRDPCPRCGVRGDVDCGHAPVKLGTQFA